MLARPTLKAAMAAALASAALLALPGCAVWRGQQSAGSYVDDTKITTAVKAKMVEDKSVDASAIKVETMNGTVMLSGFAKNETERQGAERIARGTEGVKSVKNSIAIKP